MQNNGLLLEDSLRDAICWCNWVLANGSFTPDEDSTRSDSPSPTQWLTHFDSEVERLIRRRRDKLTQVEYAAQQCFNWPGAVLVFYPHFTMHDGLTQSESTGLLDVHSCPLYHFWIGIAVDGGSKLLSWIPQPIKECVDRAMKVDAPKCLAWLGEV